MQDKEKIAKLQKDVKTFHVIVRFVKNSKFLEDDTPGIINFDPLGITTIYIRDNSEEHTTLAHEFGHFIGFLFGEKGEGLAELIEDTVRNYFRKEIEEKKSKNK